MRPNADRPAAVLLAAILLAGALLAGCAQETPTSSPKDPTPPVLPPTSSLEFDFGFFQDPAVVEGDLDAAGLAQLETLDAGAALGDSTRWHWLNAVVRVVAINLAVAEALTPPIEAFSIAIHTPPVYRGEGVFVWTYHWEEERGHIAEIELTGTFVADEIGWELRLSDNQADPPLDRVLWFRGESNAHGQRGHWIFDDLENNPERDIFRIDWDVAGADHRELKFEDIDPESEDYGNRLAYQVEGSVAQIVFWDASASLESDITWNEATGTGSLMVPDYNEGERACWNEHQYDVECGPADL